MRVLITGGGTGGHVFPGLAVAEALRRSMPEVEILFVGGRRGIETKVVPEAGLPFRAIPARGLLGRKLLAMPAVIGTTLHGLVMSLGILRRFRPDVVFATGGYVSGPVAIAGGLLGKPLILHEQNSVPGLTNRFLARIAQEVHLNDPAARRHFARRSHLKLSGNPIRPDVLRGNRPRALRHYDLRRDATTILVLGGSQGARSINRAAVGAVRRLASQRSDLQWILQTGRRDFRWVSRRLRDMAPRVRVCSFISEMGDAYAVADLVVCRAGAMTLAEVAVCGKAAILVPYPYAARDHQTGNAKSFVEVGSAVMIPDRRLHGKRLASEIAKVIDTPRKLREMSSNALLKARPRAAEKIAAALARFGPGNGVEEDVGERDRERDREQRAGAGRREGRREGPREGRREGPREGPRRGRR
ncbi:MAG: undecaprenyldiphospho-muramoylpentapeptide beta-N-acetylglucosaminyltransferase [Candidatus Eisenbacteria sp.]|nr:undecaprenyldiphospho-muramoylpentapeptide beta-N-acetylglucosaminyltransferase [Candidatus Eisenbacteria bacterium]